MAISTIKKPRGKQWPDPLELEVNGVPIRIEYKNQKIMVPNEQSDRADELGRYLIDEGLVEIAGAKKWLKTHYTKTEASLPYGLTQKHDKKPLKTIGAFGITARQAQKIYTGQAQQRVISGATRKS